MKLLLQLAYFIIVLLPINAMAAGLTPLTVEHKGRMHTLQVEVADTPEEHEQGLMFRTSLPKNEGMLFLFEKPRPVTMWMKNTPLSLDILFIGEGGSIVNIAEKAVPMSLTPIPAKEPVIAVLEINGGMAKRLGIAAGDTVKHEALQP